MTQVAAHLLLGLGNGAVFAALALALVLTYRSSAVLNFATGAVALYAAYTYAFLRQGELFIPIPGPPSTIALSGDLAIAPAMAISLVAAVALGVLSYVLIFRPLRNAPPAARAVASVGLMVMIQGAIAEGSAPRSSESARSSRTRPSGSVARSFSVTGSIWEPPSWWSPSFSPRPCATPDSDSPPARRPKRRKAPWSRACRHIESPSRTGRSAP